MAQGPRPERIAEQIRSELSQLLSREVKDPGIGFVTITHVSVTPDLQLARVYYTSLGAPTSRKQTDLALGRAAPFLRRQIGQRLRLRRVPAIEFCFDESIERQERVEQLLQEIHDAELSPRESHAGDDDRDG